MAGNKISNILFKNKQQYITHKIKHIAFIPSVLMMSLHSNNAIATPSQSLQIKSKLCKSYHEFGTIKKDQEFIEMGFAPASKHHSLLQQFQEDSKKYDSALNMECYKYKELGCKRLAGELCMTFDYLRNIALSEVSYNHGGTRSEAATQMNQDFKKFCK